MERFRWRWLLPALQITLVLSCHVYDTHVFRAGVQRDRAVNNLEYSLQHSPAWPRRLSQGVNFPALVLAYPLRNEEDVVYSRNSPYTLIWITPKDIAFFLGVVAFWYGVGRVLDHLVSRTQEAARPRRARLIGLALGAIFGALNGAYAIQMIGSRFRPDRCIGAFGAGWTLVLLSWFAWQLKSILRLTGETSGRLDGQNGGDGKR